MKIRKRLIALLLMFVFCPSATALELWPWGDAAASLRQAQLPPGFELELLVAGLDKPRMLTFAANGELLIGSKSGRIHRLQPPYREPEVLLRLDNYPHSLALRPGELLIAQTDGIYRVPYRPGQPEIEPADVRLLAALPGAVDTPVVPSASGRTAESMSASASPATAAMNTWAPSTPTK